jgi:hypothetical protein
VETGTVVARQSWGRTMPHLSVFSAMVRFQSSVQLPG